MARQSRRAMKPDAARQVRAKGHQDALVFARAIGLEADYQNDRRAKKDVIDPSGDAHSVKSGQRRWQIFLYGRNRFLNDDGFQALNGIGGLLVHCIDCFPDTFEEYQSNKATAKDRLRTPMRELKDRFQRKAVLRAFLGKSFFNGGEVDYLTILHEGKYHVFRNEDVVSIMGKHFSVVNSMARREGEFDEQKVIFRYNNRNVGELEMRNSASDHYREILFVMNCQPAKQLLLSTISLEAEFSDTVLVHGKAAARFGNWRR